MFIIQENNNNNAGNRSEGRELYAIGKYALWFLRRTPSFVEKHKLPSTLAQVITDLACIREI
jgi:hypothetical protein